MITPHDFNANFRYKGIDYNIHLSKGNKSKNSVELNGVYYKVLTDKDKLTAACEILKKATEQSSLITSDEALKDKLSLVEGISFPAGAFKSSSISSKTLGVEQTDTQFPISKIAAKEVFFGLGENWWKQIFDGKYHAFGKKVFDEGLHEKAKEPGFYASAQNAFNYAGEHLCEPLTVDFYRNLQKIACNHFQGKENQTGIEAKDAGKFRDMSSTDMFTTFKASDFIQPQINKNPIYIDQDKLLKQYLSVKRYGNATEEEVMQAISQDLEYYSEFNIPYHFTIDIYNKFDTIFENEFDILKKYLENQRKNVEGPALPEIVIK